MYLFKVEGKNLYPGNIMGYAALKPQYKTLYIIAKCETAARVKYFEVEKHCRDQVFATLLCKRDDIIPTIESLKYCESDLDLFNSFVEVNQVN